MFNTILKMKRFFFISLIFILFFSITCFAHKRAKYNIVIDTDCGIDDLRAINYFLASKDFNINAITTVDGVLPTNLAAQFINELLLLYRHEGISIGEGENYSASKKYQKHAIKAWNKLFPNIKNKDFSPAITILKNAINGSSRKTIIVALGPLSNIAKLLEDKEVAKKVEVVLWYSNLEKSSYNYEQNPDAYTFIKNNKLPLSVMSSGEEKVLYSKDFYQYCLDINTIYSLSIHKALSDLEHQLEYCDDYIPMYLLQPSLFNEQRISDFEKHIYPKPNQHFEVLATTILNSDKPDEGVVFNELPTTGYMLRNDILAYSNDIIKKHGYNEFKIVALSSEIHSHLGVYSVLGAKTGLRIMEYFHAGLDEVEIISFAGSEPPISCFNDGLQVGTGATLGYGTIKISEEKDKTPAVIVKYNGKQIMFSLKKEVVNKINSDIKELIVKYGNLTEAYWQKLRELCITEYWLKYSRFDILEIQEK